jgi:hypothetical protein
MNLRNAFLAAPALLGAYGVIRIIDGLDGSRGPGVAWTVGHLAFLAAMVLFVPIFLAMRRMAGRTALATISMVSGIAGIVTLFIQFSIDIVVGFMAADREAMGDLFDQVQAVPGLEPIVYEGGPILFYLGQLVLVILLAVAGRVKFWTPLLVLVDLILPFVDKDLIPIGAIFLLISFLPLARQSAPCTATATATVATAG